MRKSPALYLASAVIAILLSLSAVMAANKPPVPAAPQAPKPVKVLTYQPLSEDEVPGFPGKVEAGDSALLAFRVAGQIQAFRVRMGDRVNQGALLAELDPTDYQLQLDARQAEFELAQLGAERAQTLFAQQLISEDAYDTAQAGLATSEAKLEQARRQLSFCKLTAPFAGAIAFTYAMPSEVVGPQQPVLNLQDISTLEIRFNLPPRYQPLLQGEERARFSVSFELMPGVLLDARYKEADMQPDPDTNSYPVTLAVDSPEDFSARPGMPVTIRMHHSSLSNTSWVLPSDALFDRTDGRGHVWRIDPISNTVHKTAISLDAEGGLLSGLERGDQIVAAGVDRLREGQRVKRWVREGGL